MANVNISGQRPLNPELTFFRLFFHNSLYKSYFYTIAKAPPKLVRENMTKWRIFGSMTKKSVSSKVQIAGVNCSFAEIFAKDNKLKNYDRVRGKKKIRLFFIWNYSKNPIFHPLGSFNKMCMETLQNRQLNLSCSNSTVFLKRTIHCP